MDALITGAVLLVLVGLLVREVIAPSAAVVAAVVGLVLTGVMTPEEAFAGFASPATITLAGLFVVARAVRDHAGVEGLLARLLGDGAHPRRAMLRLLTPVAGLSAVLANTPLVAATAPMLRSWAERHGRPASRYLMPLSFAAILGGTLTLIGTSTTLVVSGLVRQSLGRGFGFLEVLPVGLPVAVLGLAVIVTLGPRLLPDRRSAEEQVARHEREYTYPLVVEPGGPLDGLTIREAGLRELANVFLARVDRHGHDLGPVGPETLLEGGDRLLFVGGVDALAELPVARGLKHAEERHAELLDGDGHGLVEAVIGRDSGLIGRTPKEVSFRGRYGGAILAVHRAGARVEGKLGAVPLSAGDSLLIQATPGFVDRWRGRRDFAVVVPLDDPGSGRTPRGPFVVAVLVAMVAVAAAGLVPTVTAVLGACAALIGTRTVWWRDAIDSLDLDVLLIVGGAIGLGAAVEGSGIAAGVADAIVAVASVGGSIGALLAITVGTLIMTELVTNVAAAALMVPIALSAAAQTGADPRGFAVAVAVAASASFLTPIGYQTNTIVYGLGGYRFGDYWRLGAPVTAIVPLAVVVVVPLVWG